MVAQTGTDRHLFTEWANITVPLPGDASAIGFYSAGCLQGGQLLPLDGTDYAVMRPSRRRFYGHPTLINYLTTLAAGRPGGTGKLLLTAEGRARPMYALACPMPTADTTDEKPVEDNPRP